MSNNISQGEMRVISFDFGTVNSSISWAKLPHGFAELPTSIKQIWFDSTLQETPSQIAYDRGKKCWVSGKELAESIRTPDLSGITEKDVIKMPKLCLDKRTAEHVRRRVEQQLKPLGMTNVDSVSEPEAAAGFVRRVQLQSEQHPINNPTQSVSDQLSFVDDINAKMIKPPKLYLIVDAGGGTVDLLPFEVSSHDPTFVIHERSKGSGIYSGSAILNHRFETELRGSLAPEIRRVIADLKLRIPELTLSFESVVDQVVTEFEARKQSFCGRGGMRVALSTYFNGSITIPNNTLVRVFDQIIEEIASYIADVIKNFNTNSQNISDQKHIENVMFVGGFSRNEYVLKKLKRTFEAQQRMGYPVTFGPNEEASGNRASSAVSEGAIYMAVYKNIFGKRTFQQSLGIAQDQVFDLAIHAPTRKVLDPDRGEYEARNCYVPFCYEHEEFQESQVRYARSWRSPSERGDLDIKEWLYGCDGVKNNLDVTDPSNGFEKVAEMSFHIPASRLHDACWEKRKLNPNSRKMVYYLEYVIRMEGKYPLNRLEIILPKKGKFRDPETDRIPSPEELEEDTLRMPAVLLPAAGTLNAAMDPYRGQQANHTPAEPDLGEMISWVEEPEDSMSGAKCPLAAQRPKITPQRSTQPVNTVPPGLSTRSSRSTATLPTSDYNIDESMSGAKRSRAGWRAEIIPSRSDQSDNTAPSGISTRSSRSSATLLTSEHDVDESMSGAKRRPTAWRAKIIPRRSQQATNTAPPALSTRSNRSSVTLLMSDHDVDEEPVTKRCRQGGRGY